MIVVHACARVIVGRRDDSDACVRVKVYVRVGEWRVDQLDFAHKLVCV